MRSLRGPTTYFLSSLLYTFSQMGCPADAPSGSMVGRGDGGWRSAEANLGLSEEERRDATGATDAAGLSHIDVAGDPAADVRALSVDLRAADVRDAGPFGSCAEILAGWSSLVADLDKTCVVDADCVIVGGSNNSCEPRGLGPYCGPSVNGAAFARSLGPRLVSAFAQAACYRAGASDCGLSEPACEHGRCGTRHLLGCHEPPKDAAPDIAADRPPG